MKNKLQNEDLRKLRILFQESFDLAKFQQIFNHLDTVQNVYVNFIAEGTHFRVYKLIGTAPLPLVLSVAKENFQHGMPSHIQQWIRNLQLLKKNELNLVPPFEILKNDDDEVGLIMPYCEKDKTQVAYYWQPLPEVCSSFQSSLNNIGLEIDDYLQIRSCQYVPLVHDLSDLKQLE